MRMAASQHCWEGLPCNSHWEKAALTVPSLPLALPLHRESIFRQLVVSFESTMESNLFSSPEDFCMDIIHISWDLPDDVDVP